MRLEAPKPQPELPPGLALYDYTRGGNFYSYFGHTNVKILGLFVQDQLKYGNWTSTSASAATSTTALPSRARRNRASGSLTTSSPAPPCSASLTRARWKLPSTRTSCSPARAAPTPSCRRCYLVRRASPESFSPASAMSFMPPSSRPSASTSWPAASTSGSTPTTPSTFPSWATPPSLSGRLAQLQDPRLRSALRDAGVATASAPTASCPPCRRASSRRRSAGAGATVGQTGLPFRIDHDENFNQNSCSVHHFPRQGSRRPLGRIQLAL